MSGANPVAKKTFEERLVGMMNYLIDKWDIDVKGIGAEQLFQDFRLSLDQNGLKLAEFTKEPRHAPQEEDREE